MVSLYSVINHMAYFIGESVKKSIFNVCLFFKQSSTLRLSKRIIGYITKYLYMKKQTTVYLNLIYLIHF